MPIPKKDLVANMQSIEELFYGDDSLPGKVNSVSIFIGNCPKSQQKELTEFAAEVFSTIKELSEFPRDFAAAIIGA
jgi:hypothetical protein